MSAILNGNHLSLIGTVGNYWDGDSFSHSDVVRLLLGVRSETALVVSINSPGGACDDGLGIYNALKARRGHVHVIIEGLAASAASLIAMAGDRITMRSGSLIMIHEAMTDVFNGNSELLEEAVRQQAAWTDSSCEIYAERTGKTVAAVRQLLRPETWLSAQEAVDQGFADDIDRNDIDLDQYAPAFAYQRFERAPASLVALAKSRNWSLPRRAPNTSIRSQESKMSKEPAAGAAHATATSRIKAIMKADDAEGCTELAEHLAYETDLDPAVAIAIMKAAPKTDDRNNEWRPPHMSAPGPNGEWRGNAYGLRGGGYVGKQESRLVAAMKSRDGGK